MLDSFLEMPSLLFFLYMSFLWLLAVKYRNYGLVDFGWPSGFTALAIYYSVTGHGFWLRKTLIASMFAICGARFMIGWTARNLRDGEDRRWRFWRERWADGKGLFSIRNIPTNLFAFFHAQTFATLLVLIAPVRVACKNSTESIGWLEWFGITIWISSFVLENVADAQLDNFRRSGNNGVCKVGLWRYSRHPNYFFEFLIWCGYTSFALQSVETAKEFVVMLLVPVTAYWFLVHFTGIPITEQASLKRRGESYAAYQAVTNRFFPWPPKSLQTNEPSARQRSNPYGGN